MVYIYIYICVCVCVCVFIYTHICQIYGIYNINLYIYIYMCVCVFTLILKNEALKIIHLLTFEEIFAQLNLMPIGPCIVVIIEE